MPLDLHQQDVVRSHVGDSEDVLDREFGHTASEMPFKRLTQLSQQECFRSSFRKKQSILSDEERHTRSRFCVLAYEWTRADKMAWRSTEQTALVGPASPELTCQKLPGVNRTAT